MQTFYKDPLVQILEEINAKNSATLKRELTASDIKLVQVSSNDETGAREVMIRPAAGSEYYGVVKNPGVTYNRYVGQKLFVVQPRIWGLPGESYDVLVQRMAQMYNLPPFTIEPAEGDLENPYDFGKDLRTRKADDTEFHSFTMQIEFRGDSIGYTGIFPIIVFNANLDLGKIIKNVQLEGLMYPDNTGGLTGSLSTLTYPITFTLPSISKEVLGVVGAQLSTDVSDATVKAIVDQILSYYETSNISDFTRADIEAVIAGATVAESNLMGDGGVENTVDVQIVLTGTTVENAKFIGSIYIRSPEFEA